MSLRREHEELTVITKTYDLILWSCHHTGKFPRNHRFVLGERIVRNLYDLLETLIQAKYTRRRQRVCLRAIKSVAVTEGYRRGDTLDNRRSGSHRNRGRGCLRGR